MKLRAARAAAGSYVDEGCSCSVVNPTKGGLMPMLEALNGNRIRLGVEG